MTGSSSKQIVFGLLNFEGKYLTAEKFGDQINVTGSALRSKQMWTFEKYNDSSVKGYLRSWQDKYLETNKNGNVVCVNKESDGDYLFEIEITDAGSMAFKDIYGKYLAGNVERLFTTFKPNKESTWSPHYTMHPQCNIKSISRKRYAYLFEKEFRADEDIAWGVESIITLSFRNGLYALIDSFGRYLNGTSGELVKVCNDKECLFSLSLQGDNFALRCTNGNFLTVHGQNGRLIATKQSIGKDETFSIEQTKPQVVLTASNGRMASIKQGIDITANQTLPYEDTEIFQIGYHLGRTDKLTFLTRNNKYWVASVKSITASSDRLTPNSVFKMSYINNKVALNAFNNKFITSTSGGLLAPSAETADTNTLFSLTLINRPMVMLRGCYGYIGATNSSKIQCNLGAPELLKIVEENGQYMLKTMHEFSFKVESDLSISTTVEDGDFFFIELHSMNKLQIKAPNGQYLIGNQNGTIIAGGDKTDSNTLWEY